LPISTRRNNLETIGFVGAGNMAEALIKGIISARLYSPKNIFISDVKPDRLRVLVDKYGVKATATNAELAAKVNTLILSVKPQIMAEALKSIQGSVDPDKLVISIAAGIKVSQISSVLCDVPIVRVMPNTPALIGEGASAIFASDKAKAMLDKALSIFSSVGKAVIVDNEELIDAVTAVSGSGPAYFFLLMEEMIKAGTDLGLPERAAKELVLQTAKGAGILAMDSDKRGEGPAVLRQKVTSPGGTTEAALKVLADGNISALISAAVKRACERSVELSRQNPRR
jgi:pyrroline-5-carboxylate reductase